MTLTISHQNYEAVRPDYGIFSVKFHSSISEYHRMYLHELMMRLAYTGSGGIVANYSDYSAYSFRIGSSTCVVAAQPKVRVARDSASLRPLGIQGNLKFTVFEHLQELQAALSLNKSQLAGILRVSRPTLYEWFRGKDPNTANAARLHALSRCLKQARVSATNPLNARFVRHPARPESPALIDLLTEEQINEFRVVDAIIQVQALEQEAASPRASRDALLQKLVFEDPGQEQRREQLAKNIALLPWPKR